MCIAGGRRCPGSGTPSARQRAKRKANQAYRKAVANEIEKTTGDTDLARKVRNLPMTDVADVVTAARLDAAAIAKSAGQASYTDKDGHITTVDVKPAGTTWRTPISKEAKAVLAEVDDKVGAFEEGTAFHAAVVSGDRARQDELRSEAAEDINAAAEEYDNTSLPGLKDHELDEAIEKYQKLVDEAYACTDDRVVQAKAEEMLRVSKGEETRRKAAFHGHPIDDLTPSTDDSEQENSTTPRTLEEKYADSSKLNRASLLNEWAKDNTDHPAASVIAGQFDDKELSAAAKWARGVFDEDKPEASELDKGIARTVFAKEDDKFLREHRRDVMGKKYSDDTSRYLYTLEDFYDAAENGTMPYEDNAQLKKDVDNLRAHQRAFYGADPEANADKIVSRTFEGKNLDEMPLADVKALANKSFMEWMADPESENNDDVGRLYRYTAMRSSLEEFEDVTRDVEKDQPTNLRDAVTLHRRCMDRGKEVFAATEDPYARKKVLDTADITRKRARNLARSARSLNKVPRDCWPNNVEGREMNPGFYAKNIGDFEHLSPTNSPSMSGCGAHTPWGTYSVRGNTLDDQVVFVSTDKSGSSSVIRVPMPTERNEDINLPAREAYFFNELTRAQREVKATGNRDVSTGAGANYATFERVFTDLNSQRGGDNGVAHAMTRLPYEMSRRDRDTAFEADRDSWKESADTLRKAVGTNPYDNDEDNAMFDSMCTQAADTYEYELDRLEKLRSGR